MSAIKTNYKEWIAKANEDRIAMESIVAGKEVPWAIVCFHAQQTAEKFLKAYLINNLIVPQRTHLLTALHKQCLANDPSLDLIRIDCSELESFAVAVRYPIGTNPNEETSLKAMASAERIRAAILKRLPDSHA